MCLSAGFVAMPNLNSTFISFKINIKKKMNRFFTIFCLLLSINAFVNAGEYEEDEDVLVLKVSDFDAAVAEFKYVLVEFCKSIVLLFL